MKVAIFGGTGFVGSYLIDALVAADHQPVVLVRKGNEYRVNQPERCTLVSGDIEDDNAIEATLDGADAAIYNIGILREFPDRGITFDSLHHESARQVIDAAQVAGANRFLLMSANGVKPDGTAYQKTKYATEQYLMASELAWTIFQPSVIFGDPRGRMEFATQLAQDIIGSPMPAPLFYPGLLPTGAGEFTMSPVHVRNVAQAFIRSLADDETIGKIYRLGGPATLTWKAILRRIAAARGKRKLMLPVPACGVSAAARVFDRFEAFPVTRDQITMLLEGNACPVDDLVDLGIEPVAFEIENLAYLNYIDVPNQS
jgi:NADH dehydrogenase